MDLNRANTFIRVVESGGFSKAAVVLGLPTSSVSRSVSRLEEELGVTLLERTTRKVTLTDAGKAYFDRARDALAGLEEANTLALDAAQSIHGMVRVAMPPDFAERSAYLFSRFAAEHPHVRVELTFTSRGADLIGDLVDLAIVFGRLPDSPLLTRRLGKMRHRLFASAAYLEKRGKPRTPADLARHDLILYRARGGSLRWQLTGPHGIEEIDVSGRISADHFGFVVDATIAGSGIALLPEFAAHSVPTTPGQALVEVLPRWHTDHMLHLLSHSQRHMPRRVALLRDFLGETLTSACSEAGATL
jgi:DNA-binding transcriptional LysR family regulator